MNTIQPGELEKYRALPWSFAHVALNNFFYTWTFGGSVFLLFLSQLGLPKDQIGVLLSLFPFAGLLALVAGPLVARWGRKKVFLLGFGIRKPVMASLLLLPWLLANAGYHLAVAYLFMVILAVAVLRAVAETAQYPWIQEFVPNAVRGKFGAVNTVLVMGTSLAALFVASRVIAQGNGLPGYMLLIAAGAIIGLVGVAVMGFVPGGAPIRSLEASGNHISHLKACLRDQNFVYFLGGMGCYSLGAFMLGSFLPLYVKEQFGVLPSSVVLLDMASMVGGAVASIFSGVIADRVGSRPVMMPGLAASILVPAGWLLVSRQAPGILLWSGALYFLYGAVSNSASIGAGRLLFNGVIPMEKNTEYTSIYYAWAGLTGGIAPLLGGWLLASLSGWQVGTGIWRLDGFRLLFLFSLLAFTGSFLLYKQVKPDAAYSTRAAIKQLWAWRRLRR